MTILNTDLEPIPNLNGTSDLVPGQSSVLTCHPHQGYTIQHPAGTAWGLCWVGVKTAPDVTCSYWGTFVAFISVSFYFVISHFTLEYCLLYLFTFLQSIIGLRIG